MTAEEYRDAIEALGMGPLEAARLFQINSRTSRRFSSGEYPVSWEIELLLNIMVAKGISIDEIVDATECGDRMPRAVAQIFHLLAIRRITADEIFTSGNLGLPSGITKPRRRER